jgi:GNAT superfamily N-acetyltransferase
MKVKLQVATPADAADLVALHVAVNEALASRFGGKAEHPTDKGILFHMRRGTIYLARYRKKPIATLALSTRKPWAIDRSYITPVKRPLFLTGMAVAPALQRRGVGRACLEQAVRFARDWPADSVCLDAFDLPKGAGPFYEKCGFREIGRGVYRVAPLIYYEMLL